VSQKIDLLKLPIAESAAFDSYADELDARCHPETRVELRQQIKEWADNSQGKCIFWLCGIAGTGKSTISRTVAQSFADKGQLGGSFFFKRGEGDRGNASRFFTTITAQLVIKIPTLLSFVSEAIEADPSLTGKSMKEQFEKLLLQPLSKVSDQMLRLIIVIDALDECERERDINTILLLLPQIQHVASVSLKVFVTSRPELPIRLGFKNMSGVAYQDMILHEIPRATIEHDISAFLKHEFGKIRNTNNHLHPSHVLPSDWPGEMNLKTLVDMAIPLFIFAATVCRYVGDVRWDPQQRLRTVLKYQTASQASKLDRTYFPILNGLLIDLSDEESKTLIEEFQYVVGSIVLLASPLSTVSLARLLDIPEEVINCRLDSLHSVLSVPIDRQLPIRLLHLSFREFLIDSQKESKCPFWVDDKKTHKFVATKCLELMSNSLKENICDLRNPGTLQAEVERQTIDNSLTADVQYACCYWVYHLEQGGSQISDHSTPHSFLSEDLLHWLEALSLIGRLHESIAMISSLITLIYVNLLMLECSPILLTGN
jgi:NACHT domain